MNVLNVFINACIWQGTTFDPLLVKTKSGAWTFISEEFDMTDDKNVVRHTLERGLYKKLKGTLNPQNARNANVSMYAKLAEKLPLVVFTSPSGERCIRQPHAYQQVHVNIVVPLFEMQRDRSLEGLDVYSRIIARGEPVKAIVNRVMQDKKPEWSQLQPEKRPALTALDGHQTAYKMRRKGIPYELAKRVTQSQSEVFWLPPPVNLQSVP